jgi:hypothetical protein
VLVLGALGFRDRKETDGLQLICSVSLIAKRSGFSRTTPQIRNLGLTRCSPLSDVRCRIAQERVPTYQHNMRRRIARSASYESQRHRLIKDD